MAIMYIAGEDGQYHKIPTLKGEKGDPGFSPNCVVEQTQTGAVVYCTDADGTTTANITNGTNGTSCTHSWNGTTLTVTSASGTSSANLKGEKGDDGEDYIITSTDYDAIADVVITKLTSAESVSV